MWSPTHVQVTVQKARDLLTKGKNGTNDAFVTIALGKEKYQTSVKEKASGAVEWHEECELQIPEHGNTAEVVLSALHRNFLGVDEFLGMVSIPLSDFDVYERPRNRWYTLKSKPGKEKNKPRGELEVKIAFIVKAGSLTDLSKKEKHKSSLGQLGQVAHSVGGSLLSIGSSDKRKSLKRFAKSIGSKVSRKDKHRSDSFKEEGSFDNSHVEDSPSFSRMTGRTLGGGQIKGEADPGVISEDEDEFAFDELSHKSSASSLSNSNAVPSSYSNTSTLPVANSLENLAGGEFLRRTSELPPAVAAPAKPPRNSPEKTTIVDEWDEKIFGRKDTISIGSGSLKRRSWKEEAPKVEKQPEEPEKEKEKEPEKPPSPKKTLAPQPMPRVPSKSSFKEIIVETEKEEEKKKKDNNKENKEKEPKEKDGIFSRKLKAFKKDSPNDLTPTKPTVVSLINANAPYERIIIGGESDKPNPRITSKRLPSEVMEKFKDKSREELIELVCNLQCAVELQQKRMKDMEDYLDDLLLRVMETTPRILQNPKVLH
ncbi:rab11 family-interacting protein 1 isoform X2 [Neocloeon triangulifer]|uniref:rab11 family-interacting protein 1 isoform X2 n=1 Tax=Neocloeon triangulifer TaxID=2078957 RepID=UPI00286F823C|nr:rab11 family-interacting protein 1 isoform X2 [Neocloeon triangulifer]